MSIINVRTGIYNAINGIKTAAGIATLSKYEPVAAGTTPHVAIVYDGGGEDDSTNSQNTLISSFIIRTMAEVEGDDDTKITQLLTIVDAILAELRDEDNRCLSGATYNLQIKEVGGVYIDQKEDLRLYVVDIRLEAKSFETT